LIKNGRRGPFNGHSRRKGALALLRREKKSNQNGGGGGGGKRGKDEGEDPYLSTAEKKRFPVFLIKKNVSAEKSSAIYTALKKTLIQKKAHTETGCRKGRGRGAVARKEADVSSTRARGGRPERPKTAEDSVNRDPRPKLVRGSEEPSSPQRSDVGGPIPGESDAETALA